MQDEFPDLDYHNYQDEFLSDWWTRKKLFKGLRASGKTTLIVSELRRFLNRDMDCLVLTPTIRMGNDIKERYQKRFGEIPNCKFQNFNSSLKGQNFDVVLIDEIQKLSSVKFDYQVVPMMPMFIRACGCLSDSQSTFHLDAEDGESGYFDSVYTSV